MINKFTVELEIEHNGSCSTQEMADCLQLQAEYQVDTPDDFGITKVVVTSISVDDLKINLMEGE